MSMQPFPQKQAGYPPHVVHDGPHNPLFPKSWVFTFGLDHPLSRRYVQLTGNEEHCRALMSRIFGQGNWAACYRDDVASRVIDRGRLTLLDLGLNP